MGPTYAEYLTQISLLSVADPTGACPILSISGSGTIVTVSCIATVPFQVGANITISGANPVVYNGTYPITASTNMGDITTIQFASTEVSVYVNGGLAGTDPNFVAFIPGMITRAELRILRDMDLLNTLTSNTTFATVSNQQTISIPQDTFITLRSIDILTPAGVSTTATALSKVTEEFIGNTWNLGTDPGTPEMFSVFGGDTTSPTTTPFMVLFGPIPDSIYNLIIRGTVRPTSLYVLAQIDPLTAQTFISSELYDLFEMASMIEISDYQRNWGRQSDDPQMAVSYVSQYKDLLNSAMIEEARKKFESAGWTSQSAPAAATPNR